MPIPKKRKGKLESKRKKIHELVKVSPDPCNYKESDKLVCNSLVGIEIELEGVVGLRVKHDKFSSYWNVVDDGSLRDGGMEYVLARPFAGQDLIDALSIFDKGVSKSGHKIRVSERTSVHIHIDVRGLNYDQLMKFVCLYTIFEGALFNIAGKERSNNIFSTSLANSEGHISLLGRYGDNPSKEEAYYLLRKFTKYSACNLAAVPKYGSLEFRNHSGTYDTDKILHWINVLLLLKKSASDIEIPTQEVFNSISSDGAISFFRRIFGELSEDMMYPELEFDMYSGIRLSQDIIHSSNLYADITFPKEEDPENTLFSKYYKSTKPKRFEERYKRYYSKTTGASQMWKGVGSVGVFGRIRGDLHDEEELLHIPEEVVEYRIVNDIAELDV